MESLSFCVLEEKVFESDEQDEDNNGRHNASMAFSIVGWKRIFEEILESKNVMDFFGVHREIFFA